jgi:hypothetical protein
MDSDIDPADPADEVRQTKVRIQTEALNDPDHRVAVFSVGREIENDVDPQIFRRAVAKLLGVGEELLSGLTLSGSSRYPEEVIKHLNLDAKAAKTAARKLKDKVTLAEIVASDWTSEAVAPSYVNQLVKIVERSRLV